jgi:hypothetical protein
MIAAAANAIIATAESTASTASGRLPTVVKSSMPELQTAATVHKTALNMRGFFLSDMMTPLK